MRADLKCQIKCWGNHPLGYSMYNRPPEEIDYSVASPSSKIVNIEATEYFVCGLNTLNQAICFGRTLSTPSLVTTSSISAFSGWQKFVQTQMDGNQCGLTQDHKVYCRGSRSFGLVGDGVRDSTIVDWTQIPTASFNNEQVIDLQGKGLFICALTQAHNNFLLGR